MRVFLSLALAWLAYLLMQRSVWLLSRLWTRLGWSVRIKPTLSERAIWTGKGLTNFGGHHLWDRFVTTVVVLGCATNLDEYICSMCRAQCAS